MFFFEAEGAGNPTATRIDFADFEACRLEDRNRRRGSDESLLMAMAVEQCLSPAASKVQGQFACIHLPHEKFFQQKTALRDLFGVVGSEKLRIFIPQRQ